MKVFIDEDKCCGYATCLSAAPEVFDMSVDQIAVVILPDPEVPAHLQQGCRDAADGCPTDAIIIEE